MADHSFEIFWSEPAKEDFEKIIFQIAEDAPLTAGRFGAKMLLAIESLARSPYRCPALFETPACRYLLFKRYRIVFQIDEAERIIAILAILFPYQQFDLIRLL